MTLPGDLNQRLQHQIDRLEDALRKIRGGTVPDFAPLEQDVSSLCTALLSVPGRDSIQAAEKMREMIGLLEDLAHELKDFRTVPEPDDKDGQS
jgi:hypothetical protein